MDAAREFTPMRSLRELVGLARQTCGTKALAALLFLELLVAVSEGVTLLLLVPIINGIQSDGSIQISRLGISFSVWYALGAMILVIVARAGLQWCAAVIGNSIRWRTTDELRLRTIDALLHARWDFVATERRSHLVQNVTSDIMRVNAASLQLVQITVGLFMAAAMAVVAVALSPLIGGIALLAAFAVAVSSIRNIRRSAMLGRQTNDRIKAFGAAVTDSLASIRLIRANEAADVWVAGLREEAANGRSVQSSFARASASLRSILTVASALGMVALVALGIWQSTPPANLITLVIVVSRLVAVSMQLVQNGQILANSATAVERVFELLDRAQRNQEHNEVQRSAPGPNAATRAHGGSSLLELNQVSVSYSPGAKSALTAVNLTINSGEVIAVVGPSGAGKSTLLDICLGLIRPTAGEIRFGGESRLTTQQWRQRVAYVPQDVLLVPGSIRHNLTWTTGSGQTPSDETLWSALDRTQLRSVIEALPLGLDTILGESVALSGGEQQRLTIARALVRGPELMVLDEATSALDGETETAVISSLRTSGTAIMMVTHRPDLAARADRVITLEGGRIVNIEIKTGDDAVMFGSVLGSP